MHHTLTSDDKTLKDQFFKLRTRRSIAAILEVPYATLNHILYAKINKYYKEFTITKKSGGDRIIKAPLSSMKILQRKLSHILYLVHKPRGVAHGFNINKGIKTNATPHLNRQEVFNIDLENFFPSISFGRVRGLFLSKPFSFPKEVAQTLAQICCYQGSLPQGAPTSPIISNMICTKLDHDLQGLAKSCTATYTRYADDITFSSIRLKKDIAKIYRFDHKAEVLPGEVLEDIIRLNGFYLNEKKTRIQLKGSRQEVTGVIINEKLNVNRNAIRQIRAMLNAWEKYGLSAAETEHFIKYNKKQRGYARQTKFSDIVMGKINHVKHIKGEGDPVWRKLASRYLTLTKGYDYDRYPSDYFEEMQGHLWVVKCGSGIGAGFILKDVGLVACRHVIKEFFTRGTAVNVYNKSNGHDRSYPASIVLVNKDIDLVVLNIHDPDKNAFAEFEVSAKKATPGDKLRVCGFPSYKMGDKASMRTVEISNLRTEKYYERILVLDLLWGGMSGGPALDDDLKVVGIMDQGIQTSEDVNRTSEFSIIPTSAIKLLNNPHI